jgi:hypothetical protein
MATKLSVPDALALLEEIGTELLSADADAANQLAKRISDAQFKLPASEEVAARLLALASTTGIPERMVTCCILVMPTVRPEFAEPLAALLGPTRPLAASIILEKLADVGTLEAGRLAGARLVELSDIRLSVLGSDAFVLGLAESIGEQSLCAPVALAVAHALKTGFEWQRLSAPVPVRLCESLGAALLPTARALRSVSHRFPTGLWSHDEHGPQARDLAQGARHLPPQTVGSQFEVRRVSAAKGSCPALHETDPPFQAVHQCRQGREPHPWCDPTHDAVRLDELSARRVQVDRLRDGLDRRSAGGGEQHHQLSRRSGQSPEPARPGPLGHGPQSPRATRRRVTRRCRGYRDRRGRSLRQAGLRDRCRGRAGRRGR